MKIIEQSHEILSLPDNILQVIEKAGRTCYKSEDKIGCTAPKEHPDWKWAKGSCISPKRYELNHKCDSSCPHHSSQKFTKMLRDRGHRAMLEFGDIVVRLVTNRGVTHELVRHRLCSFAQESTRYVRYGGKMEFIRPVWCSVDVLSGDIMDPDMDLNENRWLHSIYQSEQDYRYLVNCGWRPEQAREVLPNSLKTEIVVKANIREWMHIFQLRCSKKAHPQIRSLMTNLLIDLKKQIPVVFDDIGVE